MSNQRAITKATAAAYVYNKKAVLKMLSDNGASIKPTTTNEKAISVLNSFIASDRVFAKRWVEFLFKKGYIKPSDLDNDSSDLNSPASTRVSNYSNMDGEPAAMSGGGWAGIIDTGVKMFQNVFKAPETDSETIAAILALETERTKARAAAKSNAKYWVAGISVVAVLGLTGLLIYKSKK